MTSSFNEKAEKATIARTERGLTIAGTRITLYDVMDYVTTSFPVVTIGDADRVLNDPDYRDLCVNRILEIVLYIENYMGTRRIFIL
ncbi:hypothetical protein [Nostoc sp.]|uniref:hypothetical protein n=1 Tax=Nostoc sp. TaxID=1180 RepID=UPI003FA5BD60